MQLTINVGINLRGYFDVKRYSQKNRPILLKTAAQRYVKFLRQRYLINAAGGGEWPPLKNPETIERKARRAKQGLGKSSNIDQILRETDTVLNSLGIRTRGQVVYAGFTRSKDHPRGPSVNRLVIIHSEGEGTAPVREIIVLPDNGAKKLMVDDVRKEFNKKIRQSNQQNKR